MKRDCATFVWNNFVRILLLPSLLNNWLVLDYTCSLDHKLYGKQLVFRSLLDQFAKVIPFPVKLERIEEEITRNFYQWHAVRENGKIQMVNGENGKTKRKINATNKTILTH